MFHKITCPACQYKFSIPEGDMGKRHVCPNCQSPFFAGKSDPDPSGAEPPPPNPSYAKTMLGDTGAAAPPIKFNCPRCKAPLESPASEAGIKKPCPACGQRLQVPAAPPPPAVPAGAAGLQKTMLASDESKAAVQPPIKYNCPNCKKPFEVPASEALTKKNCPACGQRHQVPAAPPAGPNLNKTVLASDESRPQTPGAPGYAGSSTVPGPAGAPTTAPASHQLMIGKVPVTPMNLAIAVVALFLLFVIVPALLKGGSETQESKMARLKAEQDLKNAEEKVQQYQVLLDNQKDSQKKLQRQLDDLEAAERRRGEQMFENHRSLLNSIENDAEKKRMQLKIDEERRRFEQERRDSEAKQQRLLEEATAKLKESQRQLEQANQQKIQTQTIITAPPVYYHPWHWRYYHWW